MATRHAAALAHDSRVRQLLCVGLHQRVRHRQHRCQVLRRAVLGVDHERKPAARRHCRHLQAHQRWARSKKIRLKMAGILLKRGRAPRRRRRRCHGRRCHARRPGARDRRAHWHARYDHAHHHRSVACVQRCCDELRCSHHRSSAPDRRRLHHHSPARSRAPFERRGHRGSYPCRHCCCCCRLLVKHWRHQRPLHVRRIRRASDYYYTQSSTIYLSLFRVTMPWGGTPGGGRG